MYTRYFGFNEPPFSIAPDPRFLFMSEKHREALAHLMFGVRHGGFVLLTGEVGAGKTTICRCLLEQVPEETEVALLFNPKLTATELLSSICDDLKITYPAGTTSVKVLIDAINEHLLRLHAAGRTCVLIIDEAQNLSADVLEQMRLLTNLETNERKLLQIILIGQPELRDKLRRPELRQLAQRITARTHLGALSLTDLAAYVRHRTKIAGVERQLFSRAALDRLFQVSRGIPRLINIIADRALLGAYVKGEACVSGSTVATAAAEVLDVSRERGRPAVSRWTRPAAVTASTAIVVGLLAGGAVMLAPDTARSRLAAAWVALMSPPAAPGATVPADLKASTPSPASEAAAASPAQTQMPDVAESASVAPSPAPAEIVITSAIVGSDRPAEPALARPRAEAATLPELLWPSDLPIASSRTTAFRALLDRWELSSTSRLRDACETAAAAGLSCHQDSGTITDLRRLNRPMVLYLEDRHGRKFYGLLDGLGDGFADIIVGGRRARVSEDELAGRWLGTYTLLWRRPPGYTQPLNLGSQGPAVAWLARRLQPIDGGGAIAAAAKPVYDESLRDRVRQFQSASGLIADGVAGPQTLLLLDSVPPPPPAGPVR